MKWHKAFYLILLNVIYKVNSCQSVKSKNLGLPVLLKITLGFSICHYLWSLLTYISLTSLLDSKMEI